ncbi:sensor domain-containing protein [Taklimakanibacter lacteus]|uniref:sensor domain-containing protein n=1 Tax=Taklimakanibacter lacteus TaxID=2268456 RepID=UPI000E670636
MREKAPHGNTELPAVLAERLAGANEGLQVELARIIRSGNVIAEGDLLRAIVDILPDYLFVKDRASRFLIANRAVANDLGRESGEELIGRSDLDFLEPEIANQIIADDRRIIRTGEALIDFEELLITTSGTRKWLSTTKLPLRNSAQEIVGVLGLCRDITDRKRADILRTGEGRILEMIATDAALEEVLHEIIAFIETQLDGITGSILLLDEQMRLRHGAAPNLPESYCQAINGLPIGPSAGSCGTAAFRRETVIVSDIATDPLWADYRSLMAPYGYRSCWSRPVLSHQGQVLGTFAMYSRQIRTPTAFEMMLVGTAGRIAGIAIERRLAERRIHHMAHHDALTGLPNRALLKDRLAQLILYAERLSSTLAVAFIDLDNFKLINDGLGHDAGDEVLQIAAQRMRASVTERDTVVRVGGDEFVILFLDSAADDWFDRLRAKLGEPIAVAGHSLHLTCSAGLVTYPFDGGDVETLLTHADAAMYSAKEAGRDNLKRYSAELKERTQARLKLQEGIRNALSREEFKLVYQPQVDLRSGVVFAAEALLRWQHPQHGIIYPNQFIREAEDTGQIVEIGAWVLATACNQCKSWQSTGLARMGVSVNVSARQFRQDNWVKQVESALQASGLPPECLDLEVTESLIMEDVQRATRTMLRLKEMGVQLSVDDFGTGYSNLSALRNFPVTRLKIDQTFIRAIPHNEGDATLARAIILLGQQLNLRTIAEGVETAEQVDFLKASGCDEYQGHFFSPAVPPREFIALMKETGRPP